MARQLRAARRAGLSERAASAVESVALPRVLLDRPQCHAWRHRALPRRSGVLGFRPIRPSCAPPSCRAASPWSRKHTIGAASATPYAAYFNRGFVISQFISRYLAQRFPGHPMADALEQFKNEISSRDEDRIRAFLSGELRTVLLKLVADAKAHGDEVHAALYELSDHESSPASPRSVPARTSCSRTARSPRPREEHAADARKRDQNAAGRAALLAAGVDVGAHDRFISPPALGHNKFLVFSRGGTPEQVWTGSTNWTPTGLCTQINNGLLISDRAAAQAYRAQWQALRDGGQHPSFEPRERESHALADRAGRPRGRRALHTRARRGRSRRARPDRRGHRAGPALPHVHARRERCASRCASPDCGEARRCSCAASSAISRSGARTSRRARRRRSA